MFGRRHACAGTYGARRGRHSGRAGGSRLRQGPSAWLGLARRGHETPACRRQSCRRAGGAAPSAAQRRRSGRVSGAGAAVLTAVAAGARASARAGARAGARPRARAAPACPTPFTKASSFQTLISLVSAAEARLTANGITTPKEQIHALRGIYYGTTWSMDYAKAQGGKGEKSATRNEGFQRFTRPSEEPALTVPVDVRPMLDCGLFEALRDSPEVTDPGGRHVDVGHLVIGLDARFDPAFKNEAIFKASVGPITKDVPMGGTGLECVTWLGDLGGGAGAWPSSAWARRRPARARCSRARTTAARSTSRATWPRSWWPAAALRWSRRRSRRGRDCPTHSPRTSRRARRAQPGTPGSPAS